MSKQRRIHGVDNFLQLLIVGRHSKLVMKLSLTLFCPYAALLLSRRLGLASFPIPPLPFKRLYLLIEEACSCRGHQKVW
jgi:hypothetical protein